MSAYGCCDSYNEHAKECVWSEENPDSYENVVARRDSEVAWGKELVDEVSRLKAELEKAATLNVQKQMENDSLRSLATRMAEKARYSVLTGEGLTDLDEALAAWDEFVKGTK